MKQNHEKSANGELRKLFGQTLKQEMEQQQVSIAELAQKLNQDPQHVKQLLNGHVVRVDSYTQAFAALDLQVTNLTIIKRPVPMREQVEEYHRAHAGQPFDPTDDARPAITQCGI